MLDVQKDRLRHLVTSAILELWKKETGSTTSVLIEGTVCITGKNGRTTVIQVKDRSPGVIPDDLDIGQDDKIMEGISKLPECTPIKNGGDFYPGSRSTGKFVSDGRAEFAVRRLALTSTKKKHPIPSSNKLRKAVSAMCYRQMAGQQSALPVPQIQQQLLSPPRDSNNNHSTAVNVELNNNHNNNNNNNNNDSDFEDDARHEDQLNSTMETLDVEGDDQNDSAIADMSVNLQNLESTASPQKESKVAPSVTETEGKETSPPAMDLSRREADLLLSSPQSYTEQVREAIKRRLLSTVNASMMPISLTPFGYVFPSASNTPTAARFPPSPEIFQKPLESPFPCLPHRAGVPGWPGPASLAHSAPASVPPMDVRLLTSTFPPHMNFVGGNGLPLGLNQSPPMRQSLVAHSLHNMLGLPTSTITSPTKEKMIGSLTAKMEAESLETGDDMKKGDSEVASNGEQRVYRCDYCAKTFLFKSKYHEHLPVHTSARPFQCHLCSRTYKYKYDLRVHLRAHLGIPTKSTVCPFCTDKFGTNKLLRQHILDVHKEQQAITEEQCAKSLMNIAALTAAQSAVSSAADASCFDSNLHIDLKDERSLDYSSCSGDVKDDDEDDDVDDDVDGKMEQVWNAEGKEESGIKHQNLTTASNGIVNENLTVAVV